MIVGPQSKVRELTEDMGNTMLLRDVQVLEPGKPPVKFLGWVLQTTVDGFRLMINPQLIEDVVQDSGLASSTRQCATAGVKDRVVDETPLEREEQSYFRTQVGRSLFLSVLRPDLQYAVGQLARHASAPTVSDRIALKRLIRFLSTTRDMKLELSAMADADWAVRHGKRCSADNVANVITKRVSRNTWETLCASFGSERIRVR